MISRQIQIENLLIQQSKNSTITTTNPLPKLNSLIIKTALDRDPHFLSSYVLSLASSSSTKSLNSAKWVFSHSSITPPLFTWNTIIRAFSDSPAPLESWMLFSRLLRTSLKPDNFTYPFVLKACGRSSMLGFGGSLHSLILKVGLDSDPYIAHTLIRMLLARKVFDEMPVRDVVSWSSMIAGYVACKAPLDALKVFRGMRNAKERPNSVTLVSALSAGMKTLDIDVGKSIHGYVITNSVEVDTALGTALLEMYSKCGHVEKGFRVFDYAIREKNLQFGLS
ncbi:hypothetical protein L484_013826 [Morus notabilis]|uniref:Pentatricopeptide repeat-containing protein n=1 Tax=Morus notabilis TaxID=981085 RepID=W9SL27_9ROSA|nr:hypothetical protein L484_013826 [Morus notabilis]